jgi:hypothetical protein
VVGYDRLWGGDAGYSVGDSEGNAVSAIISADGSDLRAADNSDFNLPEGDGLYRSYTFCNNRSLFFSERVL